MAQSARRITALLLAVAAQVTWNSAHAQTVRVPDDYSSIQAAINALTNKPSLGSEILVAPGTYEETLTLTADLVLRGEETARTVLKSLRSAEPALTISGAAGAVVRNFSFQSGATGIAVESSLNVTIAGNVFDQGVGATGIDVRDLSTVDVLNNTFYDNAVAIARSANTTVIRNNIFSENVRAIDSAVADNVSYNCFYGNNSSSVFGTNYILNDDPLFVDVGRHDFHLRNGSPCIDEGFGSDTRDDSTADMGAYGGTYADKRHMIVRNVSATDASAAAGGPAADITWSANLAYSVAGYKLYYDSDKSGPPYAGSDAGNNTLPSPIDVGKVTSYRLAGLVPATTAPDKPTGLTASPGPGRLTLNWTAVAGANAYRIHFGTSSTADHSVDVGNVTTHTLTGLTDSVTYHVALSALYQPRYYVSVTAYDAHGGNDYDSDYSSEANVVVGAVLQSAISDEITAIPETPFAYPALPNEGCFIATAAFGYYSAPQVQALRAFRDRFLLTNAPGRAFVRWYYEHSPPLARRIAASAELRAVVRVLLAPCIALATVLTAGVPTALLAVSALLLILLCWVGWRRRSVANERIEHRET